MKRGYLVFGILVLVGFLVSGAGCVEDIQENTDLGAGDQVEEDINVKDVVKGNVVDTRVLVDRTRYVQAGNPPFDSTNVIFAQKRGKGYKVEISAAEEVKVEVMTDKNCLLKAQGDSFDVLTTKEGGDVVIVDEDTQSEDRNLCVNAEALSGEGQIEIKFKVTELSY